MMIVLLFSGCGGSGGDESFGGGTSTADTPPFSGGSPIADSSEPNNGEIDDDTETSGLDPEINDQENNEEAENTIDGTSITLNWTEPSEYDNGDVLSRSEIESYEVFWGLSESSLSTLTVIDNPETFEYIVDGLFQGVYYFTISVTTIYGTTSEQSNIIRKVII